MVQALRVSSMPVIETDDQSFLYRLNTFKLPKVSWETIIP